MTTRSLPGATAAQRRRRAGMAQSLPMCAKMVGMSNDDLITRAEAARRLGRSVRTVDHLRRSGHLTPHKLEGGLGHLGLRFSAREVEALVIQRQGAAAADAGTPTKERTS
jgi:hypothetical protein